MQQQPIKLPPKFLSPIYIKGKSITGPSTSSSTTYSQYQNFPTTTTTSTTTSTYTTGEQTYTTGAESYTTGLETYTTGGETYTTGAENYTTGGETYTTGLEPFTTGTTYTTGGETYSTTTDFSNFGQTSYQTGQSTYETVPIPTTSTTTTTTTTTYGSNLGITGAKPNVQLLRQGSGISPNEQQGIITTAISILQQGLTPISNKTAYFIKKKLGGDWLVIVYPKDKPIDFNMTCVQGNDYLYFTLDNNAYQVCRLR